MKFILSILFSLTFFSAHAQFDTTRIHYDSEGRPAYIKDQFIVRFHPDVLNMNMVDSLEIDTTTLDNYVRADILQYLIDSGHYDIDLGQLGTSKIFKNLTSDINYSISRMEDTIEMPAFWGTFLVEWPNDVSLTVEEVCDSLNTFYPVVQYAHPNHIYQLHTAPNDPHYSSFQKSLQLVAPFPSGGINIEPAWNIEVGKPNIIVGIFDEMVHWAHDDFGDGTTTGTKIELGWDYSKNKSIFSFSSPGNSHGTACAGIIGALRNNSDGIAGIAGGNLTVNNPGVTIYSSGVFLEGLGVSVNLLASAIVEGVSWNPSKSYGYGMHVTNHSYGGPYWNRLIHDAVKTSYLNKSIFVASRGNLSNTELQYPSCYLDPWVINVGASGTNGQYKTTGTSNGNPNYGASFDGPLDIIAPGVGEIVVSTIYSGKPFGLNPCTKPSSSDYDCFWGTSAAAPHAAGVAGLMLSQQNSEDRGNSRNLCPEDVEFLIQKYSTDVVNPFLSYPVGYDSHNGWGLLNAGTTMQHLIWPTYQVFHSTEKAPNSTSSIKVQTDQLIGPFAEPGQSVYYTADLYEVTQTYNESFPPGTQILDSWKRHSEKAGYSDNPDDFVIFDNKDFTYSFTINGNTISITTATHCWHLKEKSLPYYGMVPVNLWKPSLPWDTRPAYSIHINNNTFTSVNEDIIHGKAFKMTCYPSPVDKFVNISYYTENETQLSIEIIDINGKTIEFLNEKSIAGSNLLVLDTENLMSGIYVVRMKSDYAVSTQKIIKLN